MSEPLVLGIETSCDETGVGIVRGTTLLADAIASSVDEQARFGGVVPEVASRAHLEAMPATVQRALDEARVAISDVDAVAVTAGPGLVGALLVGTATAQAIALAADKPLYGVNHLAAHVAVDRLEHGPLPQPAVALLVSGGHSSLLRVDDVTADVTPLGATIDDAAGEAFDKVGRLLGLPFVAASFQEAVVDVLTSKAVDACEAQGVEHLLLGGGVAANSRLRHVLGERCDAAGVTLRVPRPALCTDNGAMVAALGAALVSAGRPASDLGIPVNSSLPVERILIRQ